MAPTLIVSGLFPRAALKTPALSHRNALFHSLEAGSPKQGCQQGGLPGGCDGDSAPGPPRGGWPRTPLGSQMTTFRPHLLVASVCVCLCLPLPTDTGHVGLGLPQGRVCTRCPPRPPPGTLTLTSPGRLELQHTRGHGSSPRGQVSVPELARMVSSHPESLLKVVLTTRLNATPS